ncbi:dual specificity protein phosphatase family protein [Brevundimonas sp. BAL450]|uniref:dual specificity protein phosphatase family protein n=1 Tax=Brevundimonas sp. BAL450 TaxID=1708162 RepID=UPI0018CA1883|nr:dual specificity protein phosphatase family protein [Brevundimonas sp. BAL450]MBG7614655.1 dual specificity protein phosphatase family protein [Brevundimonas sp. BAL450]
MIEVFPNLYVGSEHDERQTRGAPGWFIIHACKEPYHRQALGYSGRAASKDHPEYLIAHRPGRLILNLVDVDNVNYIGAELVDAALAAIHERIGLDKVLVHCNQGASRSPTIAFLYMVKHTDSFRGLTLEAALAAFKGLYPHYSPARGMADYVRINWARYAL